MRFCGVQFLQKFTTPQYSDEGSSFLLTLNIDNGVGHHQDAPRHYHLTDQWRWWESKATVPSVKRQRRRAGRISPAD